MTRVRHVAGRVGSTGFLYAAAGSISVLAAYLSNTDAAWYDWLALIVVSLVVGVLVPRTPIPAAGAQGECFVCGAPAVARWRSASAMRRNLYACRNHYAEINRYAWAQLKEPRVYDQEAEEEE